ncbi:hypothetical protein ACJ41O_012004 [Fusarium nematophilum]
MPNKGSGRRSEQPKSLKWAPCTPEFLLQIPGAIFSPHPDCATLEVPLDYTNDKSELIQLQLVRVNATTPPPTSSRRSVIYNPGGPGVSAVDSVVVGSDGLLNATGGKFDIVGFDPRGTRRTIPFTCDLTAAQGDILTESDAWETGRNIAEICHKDNGKTGRFISTAFVARDMMRVVDALGEDGLLRYWGSSYGTVLGQTFAAMFPNGIDRMFLDSVVAPQNYYSGFVATLIHDADEALRNTFKECIDAGPELCRLANHSAPGTTTPEALFAAFKAGLVELRGAQKFVMAPSTRSATTGFVNISLFDQVSYDVLGSLYHPHCIPATFLISDFVIQRNWTGLLDAYPKQIRELLPDQNSLTITDALRGIACSDSSFRASSREEMYPLIKATSIQGLFGDSFTRLLGDCPQWRLHAAERYEGKFENIRTKRLVLFANGKYDPVTPLGHALEAAFGFRGSGFFQHNGYGHGVAAHYSSCTNGHIRKYFENATLPPRGTECNPDQPAWKLAFSQRWSD